MIEEDNKSRIRDRDWIFNALWVAAGDKRVPKCNMNIPVTVLFSGGLPFKALETDRGTGLIERLDLSHDRFLERDLGEIGFQGLKDRSLRAMRKVLIDFSDVNQFLRAQEGAEEPYIAQVWYVDGESECISLRTADVLMRNQSWRLQVLLVQSYVPAATTTEGWFAAKNKVRSKLNKDGSEAADKFAKILAKYAEKAYLPQDSSAGRRSNIISNTLTVREMQAIFLLTAANTLYFSHTQSLQVDVQGGKRVLEDALLDERRSRESSAAEEASAELVKLVTHAENRGLSIADSFSHFDEKKNGFVDVELLISGLAKLGIGLTYPVAEALMQIIGGVGSFFVSYSDFELYIRRNSAGENRNSDAALKASASAKKAGAESAASDDLERKIGSQLRLPHQRRGAAKAALNSRNVMKATTESVDLSGFDDLPMVESAYTSVPSVSRSTELPPWASARQRDALREIKRAQKKRRGGGAELDSCGGANAEKAEGRKKSRLSSNVSAVAVPDAVGARQSNSASSLRDGSIKNSPSKAASLNLQGITADASSLVAEKLQTERDEVLHIDSGVVMTFRVVIGKGRDDANRMQEKVDSLRYRSKLEENEKVLQAADGGGAEEEGDESRSGSTPQLSESRSAADTNPYSVSRPKSESEEKDRWLAFTLILVPDVFMTLETLHKSFEPIVVKYPLARLVIVGPPGSPYTHWPRGWILNADMQSRSILSLLLHLKERGRVGERSDPVFMMGFGTGAHTLSRFVSLFLPALDWMQRRLKSVVLVNGFIHISKGFKRVCKDLRSSLLLAKPIEVAELVSSLHFSDDFLRSNNRQNCQKLFWATRRGLCSINQNDIAQIHLQDGKQYAGVLEQLRGLLIGPDVLNPADSFLMSTKIPLFVIQGTDDVFVNPTEISMAYSKKSLDSANRVLVTGVLEGLVPGSIHLSWLKCGHEILVERPAYLLALISNFIQEIRVIPDDSDDSNLNYGYQDDIDPVELAKMRREAAAREQQRLARERQEKLEAEEAEAHRQRLEQEELHRQQVLFDLELERDREAAELAGEKERRLLEEEQEARAEQLKEKEEAARKAAKREREKSSRLEAMAERKRRDVKEARKAELQELYETQRLFNERKAEAYEISRMVLEDERSSDLRVYDAECEAAELAAQLAREKIQDLFNGRREDAMKKIEEQLAFQRAERLEKRRREAEESMQKIEQEEAVFMDVSKYKLLHIPGEVSIDIEVNDEQEDAAREARDRALESIDLSREAIAECIANTHNIYKDYMSCRQKLIEAMKRQRLVEDKTMLFRTQRDDLEADIRKLQRALRLFVKGTLAAELGATAFELEELKSTLADKESTLTEFTAIGRDKENHLASTNRSVQLLKVAVAKLEDVLSKQLSSIQIVEKQLSARARKLKFQKENELITRDKHISSKSLVILRLDIVKAEYIRVKAHKEEFVDSDVLFDGVLQRCVTKTLRKHLKLERSKWEGRVQAIENEIASAQDKIDTVNEKQIICKLDLDKLSLAIKNFFRGYNRARKQSVVDDVSEALALQERASSIQARRDSENDNMSHAEMVEFLAGKPATGLASRTRKKPLDLRTKEDRKFIAIDLILHPEEYLEINVTEAEEMQFDPDYQCELKKSDLERIEKLPELIALAMPFLHSKSEVSVHRLMNIYYRDKDDAYYEKKDFLSYGIIENEKMSSILSVSSTEEKMSLTSANISPTDMSNAEIIHEILIKESRRDRVRTMAGDLQLEEKLSEDEIAWLQLDKILSPHIYEPAERATLVTNKRQRSTNVLNPEVRDPTDLVSSIVPLNSTLGNGLQISGEKGFREVAPPTLMNDGKENDRAGDKFEEIRWRFENGEVIFEAPWTCVANRDELLEIRSSIDEIGLSDHDIRCKRLMEKYYVDDDESLLGQNRMKHVQAISSGIARHVVKEEQLASENRAELLNRSVSMVAEQALNDELAANRKWGSFEVVHPASAGISSQQAYFMRAGFDVSRDHPAAFAIHPEDQNPFAEDDDSLDAIFVEKKKKREDPTGLEARQLGKKTLLTLPGDDKVETVFKNDPNSMWFICESPAELAKQEYRRTRGKVILLAEPNPLVLLDICDLALQARQSRSHRFDIPDQDDSRILEICVSIMFQGTFSEKGYRFGRIAVGLFRLQDEKGEGGITNPPRPVGFAPYDLQSPNTPESMGRIVIVHRPQLRPIQPGTFQIVIGCAAYSKYSVHVACVYAKSALPVVDKLITQAKINQARLPMCLKEIDDLIAGTRLAERKLLICNQMIRETETEAHRCEVAMESVHDLLVKDDELMTMTEDERKIHNKELAILEVEFAQSNATYTSRCIELDYIKEGIKLMHEFQRERQLEKKNLKEALEVARRDLPACMALLRSMSEATNIAILLNTTLDGKLSNSGISGAGAPPEQQRVSTPADHVRRLYRSEGYNILSLEEKQFLVLDQAMVPHKYEWETEQLEEENLRRQEQGKRPKKPRKYNPAVEAFRFSHIEIQRILSQPFAALSRQEMAVRKLLSKFHDNPEQAKRSLGQGSHGFDPHRAERTRIKMSKAMTPEELQWMSIDKTLHPEVWAYYTHEEVDGVKPNLGTKEEADSSAVSRTVSNDANDWDESVDASSKAQGIYGGKGADGTAARYGDAGEQAEAVKRIGRYLGMGKDEIEMEKQMAAGDLDAMVTGVKNKRKKRDALGWRCPFSKQKLLSIWRSNGKLNTDDEKYAFKLMLKYNGSYHAYAQIMEESKRRAANDAKMGSHIRWEAHGLVGSTDVDLRAREILLELDKAKSNKNFWMDSRVLHNENQRFPTAMVRLQLEDALDALLRGQVQERERADRIGKAGYKSDDDSVDEEMAEREAEASSDSDLEIGSAERMLAEVKKRAARREKRRLKRKKEDQKQQVHKARKMILLANKSGDALEQAALQNELGHSGCLACRSTSCEWKPTCDEEVLKVRVRELVAELERVRSEIDGEIFVSDVAIGAQLGGGNVYRRNDLVEELTNEQRELERRIHLNQIDKELHDCFKTRKEYVEVKYLHGYSTVLWTNNARKALSARQSRLVALNSAHEVIDEILDWMLDGWYFGERESNSSVTGYVPSIKKNGMLRPGQDQVLAAPAALEKVRARVEAKKKGIVMATALRGRRSEKLAPIILNAELKNLERKVAKVGSDHWHMLNETESTIRFGLFMLTFMYFRAMAFLAREKRSWSGADDAVGGSSVEGSADGNIPGTAIRMTDERRKMLDEEHRIANRRKKMDQIMARARVGEARKKAREENEKREAALKLQEIVRRQKLELSSVGLIQRAYRGHIGRKAASRWALKRAEMNALHIIMNAAATCLQRIWRGYLARVLAVETRAEMAYFIALMRAEESAHDEEEYWKTHNAARLKRGARDFFNSKFRNENQYKVLGAPIAGQEFDNSSSSEDEGSVDGDYDEPVSSPGNDGVNA